APSTAGSGPELEHVAGRQLDAGRVRGEHVDGTVGVVHAEDGRRAGVAARDATHRQALAHREHRAGDPVDASHPVPHLAAAATTEAPGALRADGRALLEDLDRVPGLQDLDVDEADDP